MTGCLSRILWRDVGARGRDGPDDRRRDGPDKLALAVQDELPRRGRHRRPGLGLPHVRVPRSCPTAPLRPPPNAGADGLPLPSSATRCRLKTPPGTLREKLGRMDWTGNAVFIPSISLVIIGLTWGGSEYAWTSAHVLAPLVIGVAGVVGWGVLEYRWVEHPTVPFRSMRNRTTWMGFGTTFIHGERQCPSRCRSPPRPARHSAVAAAPLDGGGCRLGSRDGQLPTLTALFHYRRLIASPLLLPVSCSPWHQS